MTSTSTLQPQPVSSIAGKRLSEIERYCRSQMGLAKTARHRDAWRCLAAHVAALAQEITG